MNNLIADKLRSLPQFSRIRREDAQRWIKHTAERQPDRLLWLMDRLGSGFGGSEAGALLLEAMGRPAVFSSAAELINEKLMRILPSPTNQFMRKGIVLEKAVIMATLRLYGGEIDQGTLAAFEDPSTQDPFGMSGNIDFPWLRDDGTRWLIDVKIPGSGEENLSTSDKDFHYCVQLNHYNIIAKARGLPEFDKLANIHLELPPVLTDAFVDRLTKGGQAELGAVVDEMVNILKYQRAGMRLNFSDQPINPTIDFNGTDRPLEDLIKEICAANWQAAIDGNVPSLEARADLELTEVNRQTLYELENELISLQATQKITENKIEEVQTAIKALCSQINSKGALSQTGHLNITRKPIIDEQAAELILGRYGLEIDNLRIERGKLGVRDYNTLAMAEKLKKLSVDLSGFINHPPLDPEKIIAAMENAGENPERIIKFETSVSMSRKKETLNLIKTISERIEPQLTETLASTGQIGDSTQANDQSQKIHTISR
jgi:hypothetical protein